MADTQTTSARLAQPIRDARRMAQADGCPSCVANVPVSLVARWVPLREWPTPIEGVEF